MRDGSRLRRWPVAAAVGLVGLIGLAMSPSAASACPYRGLPCKAYAANGKVMSGMYPRLDPYNQIANYAVAHEKHEARAAHRKSRTAKGRKKVHRKVSWAKERVGGKKGFKAKGRRVKAWLKDHGFSKHFIKKHWKLAVTSCFANGFAAFLTWKEQGRDTKHALVAAGFGCQSGVITAFLARR